MQRPPTESQIEAVARLESAIRARNPELAESAIFQAFSVLHPVHAPALILLIEAPWHQRHEDVVRAIQQLRSPDAVDALERTAFSVHEYLAYDEDFGLARKCTWALADIGTPEAQQALGRLAACNNSIIASYAQKRLDNWEDELHRKGHSHSTTVNQPTPPYFLWNDRQHFFTCITAADAAEAGKKVSRVTLVTEYDSHCTIYDSEGMAWGFHFVGRKEKFSMFDRLLAEVYNPRREFPVSYSKRRSYQFDELQGAYLDGVAHDDDILTQFVDGDELT